MRNTTTQYPFTTWEQIQTIHPLGTFSIIASENGLVQVELLNNSLSESIGPDCKSGNDLTAKAILQIQEYLRGERKVFDLPIHWEFFHAFEGDVLKAAFQIPFGEVATYGELAKSIGRLKAARAVGGVMRRNPILLIIPCHRVINSQRQLNGFSAPGGLETKSWLLKLEGHHIEHQKLV